MRYSVVKKKNERCRVKLERSVERKEVRSYTRIMKHLFILFIYDLINNSVFEEKVGKIQSFLFLG